MSAIVLVLLAVYGSARLVLWLRGQYRLMREQKRFPCLPSRPALPQHLPTSLTRLLECCYSERVKLVESIRAIARVLITDPDVPLGCVRDFRYRVAVFNAWAAASRWIRTVESLDEVDRHRLAAIGFDPQSFLRSSESLGATVRRTSRARALEPFDVDGVRSTRATINLLVRELECVESRLSSFGEHPYRA
ncbi:MAG: hypothetical protein H6713_10220 [Myxococcales bacterium]|nr:hypothetical protein [Myxococcales bacterium]MCB9750362.1 hypothetical protein [Myxococcales bacterium]